MGVRSHAAAPPPRARPSGPGPGATLVVVLVALVLLLANGRPVGTPDASGAAGWLLRGALALAGLAFQLDATGEALVGKALAALFAALAAGVLFAAVVRRHGLADARWAGWLLALGTTLAAAAQAWSGEAAAACAVAVAVLLLVRSEAEEDPGPAVRAGLPLGLAVALQPTTVALAVVLVGAVLVALAAPGPARPRLGRARARSSRSPASGPPRPRRRRPTGLLPGLALLASPAKGALVFAPVALVGIVGLLRALRPPARRLWDQPSAGPPPADRLRPRGRGPLRVARRRRGLGRRRLLGAAARRPRLAAAAPVRARGLRRSRDRREPAGARVGRRPGARGRHLRRPLGPAPPGTRPVAPPRGTWSAARSCSRPRERVARVARPGLEGRRLVVRERVVAPSGASGSFLSFAKAPPAPTGVDATMSAVRLEAGARVVGGPPRAEGAGRRPRLPRARGRAPAAAGDPDRRPRDGHPRPRRERLREGDPLARARRLRLLPLQAPLLLPGVGRPGPARHPARRVARSRSSRSLSSRRPSRTTSSACPEAAQALSAVKTLALLCPYRQGDGSATQVASGSKLFIALAMAAVLAPRSF